MFIFLRKTPFSNCLFMLNKIGPSSDSSHSSRRGTLADLGRNAFGKEGRSKKQLTSAASVSGPPPIEPDFMSKIRKRRETSADITVLRKGSGTVTDLKSDITRYVLIS